MPSFFTSLAQTRSLFCLPSHKVAVGLKTQTNASRTERYMNCELRSANEMASKVISVMKQFIEALHFVYSIQFWRMAILWTFSLVVSYWQLVIQAFPPHKPKSYPRCSPSTSPIRPICIITGATSGLGAATAHALSIEGFFVVLVGRSSLMLSETVRKIKDRNEHANLKAFQVDMSSLESISKFKDSLQQWLLDSHLHCSIQLLINNAGILATSHRFTADGFDQMIGTNYIGAFGLTKILLPLLRKSPIPSRIVNVSKDTVSGTSALRSKPYPGARNYEYSKLWLVLFTYELHRQVGLMNKSSRISVIAADPGVVQTNIMRELPSVVSYLALALLKLCGLLQSPESGISSILDAALSPAETSGVYFFGGHGRTINSSALSYDSKLAKELWTATSDLLLQSEFALKKTY